jgi:hypothetical protein
MVALMGSEERLPYQAILVINLAVEELRTILHGPPSGYPGL